MTRPSDPVKLVYRISRNSPDKGTSCVVVHNVRKFHYFWRDLPFWLWNFDQYGKENVWNSVITTRRNLINSNLGINKDILCRCALCTILGIFTFKLWLRHKLSAQLVLKHWIVLWNIVVDKDIMCRWAFKGNSVSNIFLEYSNFGKYWTSTEIYCQRNNCWTELTKLCTCSL